MFALDLVRVIFYGLKKKKKTITHSKGKQKEKNQNRQKTIIIIKNNNYNKKSPAVGGNTTLNQNSKFSVINWVKLSKLIMTAM